MFFISLYCFFGCFIFYFCFNMSCLVFIFLCVLGSLFLGSSSQCFWFWILFYFLDFIYSTVFVVFRNTVFLFFGDFKVFKIPSLFFFCFFFWFF
jgi:hypothetical protein